MLEGGMEVGRVEGKRWLPQDLLFDDVWINVLCVGILFSLMSLFSGIYGWCLCELTRPVCV